MNSPSHVILNTFLLRNRAGEYLKFAALGSFLPDLAITIFSIYVFSFTNYSAEYVWNDYYYNSDWQGFFQASHSFVIWGLVIGVAYLLKVNKLLWLGVGGLLHSTCDFPLHNGDAYQHFYPLSNWKFHSPVSYFEVDHYGLYWSVIEASLMIWIYIKFFRQQANWWKYLVLFWGVLMAGGAFLAILINYGIINP